MTKLAETPGVGTYQPDHDMTLEVGAPYFAPLIGDTQASSKQEIDALLTTLQTRKDVWAGLGIAERLSLLEQVRRDLQPLKKRWISAELTAKGIPPGSFAEAEEWVILATMFRAVREMQRSLQEIQAHGRPRLPGPTIQRPDGQVAVRVFPRTWADRLLFPGTSSDVWMEAGTTVQESTTSLASAYQVKSLAGKVTLVLGAGNASFLPVSDFLHKLFVELQVVILKLNPVNAHLGPLLEEGFRALVDGGFLGIVYGGMEEGSYLCKHLLVEELHMTGSDKTYEAILFGTGPEAAQRKAQGRPLIDKRFTGELGNVSPVIVVPGPWTDKEVEDQATHIATWLVANGGFACLTPRVIIQHASWPLRSGLMEEIGRVLESAPTRMAYYPGAQARHTEFSAGQRKVRQYGKPEQGHLPWTIVRSVDPNDAENICFRREAFCSLYSETAIEAADGARFLEQATDFANQTLWGTLCATLIVHPKSLQDPIMARAIDRTIARLRYGTVSLNMLAFYSAYFMTAPWGAFPGHDIADIQSGIGKTFNALMLERPQKSVTRAPFKRIDPMRVTSKNAVSFCRKLADYEATGDWRRLPGLLARALRS